MGKPGSPQEPDNRPPWRVVAALAFCALVLIVLGAALDEGWLVALGVVPVAALPIALLMPAIRISSARAPEHGSQDMNILGGALTVLGVTPSEQNASNRRPRGRAAEGAREDLRPGLSDDRKHQR
jgi:hypothetical protein